MINEPIKYDFSKVHTFKTKDHEYTINLDSMSAQRFETFQQKEIACLNYHSLNNPLEYQKSLLEAFNKQDFALMGKLLYDKQYHYALNKSNSDYVLEYCSVFIYREDEDAMFHDEMKAKEKIKDWKDNNIDITSFFSLSVMASQTLSTAYNNFIQNTLEKGKKKKEN